MPHGQLQADVMMEAVKNHGPDVVIIDEIGLKEVSGSNIPAAGGRVVIIIPSRWGKTHALHTQACGPMYMPSHMYTRALSNRHPSRLAPCRPARPD